MENNSKMPSRRAGRKEVKYNDNLVRSGGEILPVSVLNDDTLSKKRPAKRGGAKHPPEEVEENDDFKKYEDFDPRDAKSSSKKARKTNKAKLTKKGTVDKRTTEETKKNKSTTQRKNYSVGISGIRDRNDEKTISGGGCALIVVHMKAYAEEEDSDSDEEEEVDEKKMARDDDVEEEEEKKGIVAYKEEEDEDEEGEKKMAGDKDEDDDDEEEEEYEIGKDWGPLGTSGDPGHKTKSMVIDGKKVDTGLFFKALPVDGASSFALFANKALGITKRKKNGTYKGKQQWAEVESLAMAALITDQGIQSKGGLGLGFEPHHENPALRAALVLPSNPEHWSRRGKHLFFKEGWTYANCPGFFWGGRTLSGYLRGKKITTVAKFRKWQAGYFDEPVLEDVYLHELNCRNFREHKARGVAGDWDYKGSLDELENGILDLGGDDRVDFYDAEEEEEDNA